MAEIAIWLWKNQTQPKTKSSTKSKSSKSSCDLLIELINFILYSIKIRLEMAEIAMWLRKTKPNVKPNEIFPNQLGLYFFVSWVCMPNFSFLGYA